MISFCNVSFRYADGPPIFRDLTFSLSPGQTTAVMGPSGCGKTTLLKLACGLLLPDEGRVTICQGTALHLGDVRGVVFHEDTLLPWLTVTNNVTLAQRESARLDSEARPLLEDFGLGDALQRYPYELSAGMRKRVEFARALLSDNRVLLLDEPFVSLDSITRQRFWKLWRSNPMIYGRTNMVITHDLEEVLAIADEVILVEGGNPVSVRSAVPVSRLDMHNYRPGEKGAS
jgi:ABC-type nitrate/sulfonate/bicarbonate transport system ATPase subunit